MRVQLISQMFLSVVIGVGLLCFIRSLLVPYARKAPNPDWELIASAKEVLHRRMQERSKEISAARGLLLAFESAKKAYVLKWEQFFLATQAERKQTAARAAEMANWS